MIDLHVHTAHSDGHQTLVQVLQKAQAQKMKYISITDHQSVGAYQELKDPAVR